MPTTTTTTDQIRAQGDRWITAELAGDVDTLDTLTTDDFHLVGPVGFVLDKQEWLDRYRSADFTTSALTWTDVDVRAYGGAAVSIGLHAQEAAFMGNPSNGEFRITHVWVRQDDHWAIASIHLSPTMQFTPPPAAHAD